MSAAIACTLLKIEHLKHYFHYEQQIPPLKYYARLSDFNINFTEAAAARQQLSLAAARADTRKIIDI